MSPRQIADDPGRQMKKVWLGPDGIRWMMDWTFEEWGVALATLLAGLLLFIFAIPAGLVVAVVGYRAGRVVSRRASPDDPRMTFRLFTGSIAGLCLLISANPMTWVRPLWFPFALLAALLLPVYVVRSVGPVVNWNRPISYWIRLPRLVARGPREQEETEINPAALGLGIDMANASMDREWPTASPKGPASKPKPVKAKITSVPKPKGRHMLTDVSVRGFKFRGTLYHFEWRTF